MWTEPGRRDADCSKTRGGNLGPARPSIQPCHCSGPEPSRTLKNESALRAAAPPEFSTLRSSARGQLLFDADLLEHDVFGEAALDGHFDFSFNQGPGILDEFFVGQETIFADPLPRNEVFHIGDIT